MCDEKEQSISKYYKKVFFTTAGIFSTYNGISSQISSFYCLTTVRNYCYSNTVKQQTHTNLRLKPGWLYCIFALGNLPGKLWLNVVSLGHTQKGYNAIYALRCNNEVKCTQILLLPLLLQPFLNYFRFIRSWRKWQKTDEKSIIYLLKVTETFFALFFYFFIVTADSIIVP